MKTVACKTLFGNIKDVQINQLIFRASAYALVVNQGRTLLTQMRSTGKFYLPGGGVRNGETLEETVRREVKEETGVIVTAQRLLCVLEDFFYYDPFDEAYHSLLFYYWCTPHSFELLTNDQIHDQEAQNVQWRLVDELRPRDFQNHGEEILHMLNLLEGSSQLFDHEKDINGSQISNLLFLPPLTGSTRK